MGLVGEEDAPAEQVGTGASIHLPLEHLVRLTCPSTIPVLQGRLRPLVTASWSARSPVTKEHSAGFAGGQGSGYPGLEQPAGRSCRIAGCTSPSSNVPAGRYCVRVVDAEYPDPVGEHLLVLGRRPRRIARRTPPLRSVTTCPHRVSVGQGRDDTGRCRRSRCRLRAPARPPKTHAGKEQHAVSTACPKCRPGCVLQGGGVGPQHLAEIVTLCLRPHGLQGSGGCASQGLRHGAGPGTEAFPGGSLDQLVDADLAVAGSPVKVDEAIAVQHTQRLIDQRLVHRFLRPASGADRTRCGQAGDCRQAGKNLLGDASRVQHAGQFRQGAMGAAGRHSRPYARFPVPRGRMPTWASTRFPELSSRMGSEIVVPGRVNSGFAAQAGHGLVIPVAHDARGLPMRDLLGRLAECPAAAT